MTAPRIEPSAATRVRVVLSSLVHDVGKYIARTAHNVAEAPVLPLPAPLQQMLLADLYTGRVSVGPGDAGLRPSQRFAQLVPSLPQADLPSQVGLTLQAVQGPLAEIDALEPAVRAQEPSSLLRVLRLARQVDANLRGLLSESSAAAPRDRKNRRRKS